MGSLSIPRFQRSASGGAPENAVRSLVSLPHSTSNEAIALRMATMPKPVYTAPSVEAAA